MVCCCIFRSLLKRIFGVQPAVGYVPQVVISSYNLRPRKDVVYADDSDDDADDEQDDADQDTSANDEDAVDTAEDTADVDADID